MSHIKRSNVWILDNKFFSLMSHSFFSLSSVFTCSCSRSTSLCKLTVGVGRGLSVGGGGKVGIAGTERVE